MFSHCSDRHQISLCHQKKYTGAETFENKSETVRCCLLWKSSRGADLSTKLESKRECEFMVRFKFWVLHMIMLWQNNNLVQYSSKSSSANLGFQARYHCTWMVQSPQKSSQSVSVDIGDRKLTGVVNCLYRCQVPCFKPAIVHRHSLTDKTHRKFCKSNRHWVFLYFLSYLPILVRARRELLSLRINCP